MELAIAMATSLQPVTIVMEFVYPMPTMMACVTNLKLLVVRMLKLVITMLKLRMTMALVRFWTSAAFAVVMALPKALATVPAT